MRVGWVSTGILVVVAGVFQVPRLHAQDEPVLTVQGASEVRVASDVATVRLGIVAQAETADLAQGQANEVASRILDEVRRVGIGEREIRTERLVLTPVYSRQRSPDDVPEIAAYRATNTVSVRVEDLGRIGRVIDAGLGAGANQLEGVGFGLDDDGPAREEALDQAIAEARSKAGVMARALDIRLDGILSVDEGGVFIAQPQMEMARAMVFQDAGATPVAPGEVTVSASVTIRYRIAPN